MQLVQCSPHAASNALATVLLQRAGGRRRRRRRRREEEGVPLDGSGCPGSFSKDEYKYDKRKANALLHKLGHRLWSMLAFGYQSCPSCCFPPPPPHSGGGGCDRAARGIVDAVTVAVAVTRRCRKKIRRFLCTTVIDGTLPTSAFRALRRVFCPTSRYWLEFYHHRQRNSESMNNQDDDDNKDDKGAT